MELFLIASSKDAWVAEVWEEGSWNPRFTRWFYDWKLREGGSLLWEVV